jgi:hypothetical protein
MKLTIVTATTSANRSNYIRSWKETANLPWRSVIVVDAPGEIDTGLLPMDSGVCLVRYDNYLGTVPAFRIGVDKAIEAFDPDIICCFHDDLEILEHGWDTQVVDTFTKTGAGLAGFFGATGAGEDHIYKTPYDPMHLVRKGCLSNLVDAESHGGRCVDPQRVAVLDGFSLIFSRSFINQANPWMAMERIGVIHHAYDTAMGCLAKRFGFHTWFIPIYCEHHGGQTAAGDAGYQAWAKGQVEDGDQGFWRDAHRAVYDEFRDVLPFRVER